MAQQNARQDRFGNDYVLCNVKEKESGFNKGFVEIGGKLYKVEVSDNKKDGGAYWVKITKLKKRHNGSF